MDSHFVMGDMSHASTLEIYKLLVRTKWINSFLFPFCSHGIFMNFSRGSNIGATHVDQLLEQLAWIKGWSSLLDQSLEQAVE